MNYFIVGGLGFIGSNLARKLLKESSNCVTIYDNYTSGHEWHLGDCLGASNLKIVRGDVKDLEALTSAMGGHDLVYHFASNPDISKAMTDPTIDFWEGTYLTQNVVEAMRRSQVPRLLYASGSGVYGDVGEVPVFEALSPLHPTSTYGASKLAGEALICSYCHMFGMTARCFRFANVVGENQTHGVTYDFVRRLSANPNVLPILGNGSQSKSYIHSLDVIRAMRLFESPTGAIFDSFNVATEDYISVTEIAQMCVKLLKLTDVEFNYSGGDRGWKGDVPIVRFDTSKIRSLGWSNALTSQQAIEKSIQSVISNISEGKIVYLA